MCRAYFPNESFTQEELAEVMRFYQYTEEQASTLLRRVPKNQTISTHLTCFGRSIITIEDRTDNLKRFQQVQASEPSQEWLEAAIARKHKPIVIKAKGEK